MNEERREAPVSENEDALRSDPQLSLWSSEPQPSIPDPATPPSGEWIPSPPPLPRREPPWSIEDLIAFIVFAFLSFIFANLVAVSIYSGLHKPGSPMSMEGALTQTPWVVSMQTGWELLWLLFIYFTIRRKYHRQFWEAMRWVRAPGSPVVYVAAGALLAVVAQLLTQLFPSEKHLPIEKLFSSQESAWVLTFFGIVVAPFVEELVFRGFFYPVFERLWGLAAAVVLTALLFAGIHYPQLSGGWQELTAIFLVGVAFSYCRGKTRSLVAPYLMHIAYNGVLFLSLYVSTDRFRTLKG